MTISFSTTWKDGTPTYFIESILGGMYQNHDEWKVVYQYYENLGIDFSNRIQVAVFFKTKKYNFDYDYFIKVQIGDIDPKIQTIRHGKRKYKKGDSLHMVINNRSSDRFQFAPIVICQSVQLINIDWSYDDEDPTNNECCISVDDYYVDDPDQLAINDGFKDAFHFSTFFNNDIEGQIIHWTEVEYKPFTEL